MEQPFSLADATVGIVGLGLMGGSLALALQGQCRRVVGSDMDAATIQEACRRGAVAAADQNPACVLPGVDLIILAVPVPAVIALLDSLPEIIPNPCIVIDIASTKRAIIRAMARLPERFEPIGGHPLCGKETLSFANAEAGLYRDASFFLTPLERTTPRALSAAHQMIAAVGAKPVFVRPEEHDERLAETSHLPFLLSSALSLAVNEDCAPFAGPGFRSTSRLACTSSSMMLGVMQSNRDNLLQALHRVQDRLARMERALDSEDYRGLEEMLTEARRKHKALVQ